MAWSDTDPSADPHKDDVMETKFPYMEFPYPGIKDISKRKGRRFIKTHLPAHLLPESFAESKAKVHKIVVLLLSSILMNSRVSDTESESCEL